MDEKVKTITLQIDQRELATILAALRFHQDENLQGTQVILDKCIREVAMDGGMLNPLSHQEVDELCQRLNLGAEKTAWQSCQHAWQTIQGWALPSDDGTWHQCSHCGGTMRRFVDQDGGSSDEVYPPHDELAGPEYRPPPLLIGPPPAAGAEQSPFRVVYVVEVEADDEKDAARWACRILSDPGTPEPDAWVIDQCGRASMVTPGQEQDSPPGEKGA
jgi:hypothetical protein